MSTAGRQPRARFRYLGDPVFLTAVALHLLNRFAIRPFTDDASDFWHCWFNDLLCVPFWLPPLLWLLRVLGLRRHDAPPTVLELLEMVVLWSAIFEWLVPTTRLAAYFPAAVGDPVDVAMYAAGAAIGGWLWGSGRKGPAIEPPPGPAIAQHWLVAVLIVGKTVVGAMLCLLVLAICPDGTFENARVRLARRSVEDLAAAILAERKRTGSLPPTLPDDLAERFPGDAFRYRPEGEQFVVIDLGSDHALGGTGAAADLWWPATRQPPAPPWAWLHWVDTPAALVTGTVVGLFIAWRWLRHRRRRQPPYEPLDAAAWHALPDHFFVPIGYAAFVLFWQHLVLIPGYGSH